MNSVSDKITYFAPNCIKSKDEFRACKEDPRLQIEAMLSLGWLFWAKPLKIGRKKTDIYTRQIFN